MSEIIEPITLPPAKNPEQEGQWLQETLLAWLDSEFIPEAANQQIAKRAAQIYVRQRMEGESVKEDSHYRQLIRQMISELEEVLTTLRY